MIICIDNIAIDWKASGMQLMHCVSSDSHTSVGRMEVYLVRGLNRYYVMCTIIYGDEGSD